MVALIAGNIETLDTQDLEGGLGDWGADTNCTVTSSTDWAHNGTHSLKMTAIATGDMTAQTTVRKTIDPALTYVITGWFRAGSVSQSWVIFVNWFDSGGTYITTTFYGPVIDNNTTDMQVN